LQLISEHTQLNSFQIWHMQEILIQYSPSLCGSISD